MSGKEEPLIQEVWDAINLLRQEVSFISDSMGTIRFQLDGVRELLQRLHPQFAHETEIICHLPYRPVH